jgi:hypothetical protein
MQISRNPGLRDIAAGYYCEYCRGIFKVVRRMADKENVALGTGLEK